MCWGGACRRDVSCVSGRHNVSVTRIQGCLYLKRFDSFFLKMREKCLKCVFLYVVQEEQTGCAEQFGIF